MTTTVKLANVEFASIVGRNPMKHLGLFVALLLMALMVMPTAAQDQMMDLKGTTASTLSDEKLVDIDAYVAEALDRYDIPGVTIAIVQNGKIVHINGFGVRKLGDTVPVNPDTLFMIGSVPKSMTAMMIGTLIDDGLLTWDTPVKDILPSFKLANPESSSAVTFRDLLSMRSGLPNFDISVFVQPYSPEQIIDSLATIPLIAKPGETYAYSNQGYAAAGFIAALAAGAHFGDNIYETYARLMQERVFAPLGMNRTTFNFDTGVNDQNVASPHSFDLANGGFAAFSVGLEQGAFSVIPAGGSTWSTAGDLARYLITQMNHGVSADGKRLISGERLMDTWKPEIPTPNNTHYGLGWVIRPAYHGLQQIEYGGGNLGYTSFISFLPEANLGVVVLTNRVAGDDFTAAMTRYIYETAFGLQHESDADHLANEQGLQGMVEQMRGGIEVHVDPAAVNNYVGDYEHDIHVEFNSGDLVLATAFGDFPLYAIPGQTGTFALGLTLGFGVQFAEDGRSFTISAGESQAPVTIVRVN